MKRLLAVLAIAGGCFAQDVGSGVVVEWYETAIAAPAVPLYEPVLYSYIPVCYVKMYTDNPRTESFEVQVKFGNDVVKISRVIRSRAPNTATVLALPTDGELVTDVLVAEISRPVRYPRSVPTPRDGNGNNN